MYSLMTLYADDNSDEILLNKIRIGPKGHTQEAYSRGLSIDFKLSDELIIESVLNKIPVTYHENTKRITIDKFLEYPFSKSRLHFGYKNDIFIPEDSKEIEESLKTTEIGCLDYTDKIIFFPVFTYKDVTLLYTPIKSRYYIKESPSNNLIHIYPDGSMIFYNLMKTFRCKGSVIMHILDDRPDILNEIELIKRNFGPFGQIIQPEEDPPKVNNKINGFSKKGLECMQNNILNNNVDVNFMIKFIDYVFRIQTEIRLSKIPGDLMFIFSS